MRTSAILSSTLLSYSPIVKIFTEQEFVTVSLKNSPFEKTEVMTLICLICNELIHTKNFKINTLINCNLKKTS
jgi:hypothetical protein